MSIGTKMRGVGESTYYTKLLRPQLEEVLNDSNYEMEHILGKRKLVVHTDRISDELNESIIMLLERESPKINEVERYNHHIDISWRDINKYAGFTNMPDLYAAYPDFQNDLTSDSGWIYSLTNLKYIDNTKIGVGDVHWRAFRNFKANYAYFYVPNLTRIDSQLLAGDRNAPPEVEIYAPKLTTSGRIVADTGNWVKKVTAYLPLLSRGDHAFHANSKLTFFEGELPSLSYGYNAFNQTQLNKSSALRVLNSIPSYTSGNHPLTIGIHVDLQIDEEVLEVISNAETKGWTMTVQWNGDSTKDELLSSEIINKLDLTSIQLPENYTRLLYLESDENGQNINTNYVPTNNTGISVIAKQITSFDGVPLGCGNMTTNAKGRIYEGQLNYLNSKIASVYLNDGTYKENTLTDLSFTPSSPIHLFGYYSNTNNSINSIWKGRIYRVTITENDSIVKDFIPCLDQNNVPCMYDIVNENAYYNTKEGTSFGYEEPKEEMYNITTTYGMRGRYFQPVIYAKLSEIERPDGSKEQNIDWGHYVTNPEDYQDFSSLEEAKEYFGISEES